MIRTRIERFGWGESLYFTLDDDHYPTGHYKEINGYMCIQFAIRRWRRVLPFFKKEEYIEEVWITEGDIFFDEIEELQCSTLTK